MESLLQKSGKIRSLMKELRTKYDGDEGATKFIPESSAAITIHGVSSPYAITLPRCFESLKVEVGKLDSVHDGLQEVWANGEAQGFFTEKLLVQHKILDFNRTCFGFTATIILKAYTTALHLLRFYQEAEQKMKQATLAWGTQVECNAKISRVVKCRISLKSSRLKEGR